MAGLIKFRLNKYVNGDRHKSIYGFKPKAVIKFERVTIGQIIDNEVYFYIRVKPGESKHVCLIIFQYCGKLLAVIWKLKMQ